MTGRRLVVVGFFAFVASAFAFAPASLVRSFVAEVPGLSVSSLSGTVWRGRAALVYRGLPIGDLAFAFRPVELLRLRVGYSIDLAGERADVSGRAAIGVRSFEVVAEGTVDFALAAAELARYELSIPGTLALAPLELDGRYGAPLPNARGEVRWNGGTVRYALGGTTREVLLPPLAGFLDSSVGHPQMTVYAVDDPTPLLLAHVQPDGLASIGITKQFTKLIGQPWVGGEEDHAVVLEVSEKLF